MSLRLVITRVATQQLEELADYAAAQGSVQTKLDLLEAIARKLAFITENPFMYRRSARLPGVHECVVNARTIMLYRPTTEVVEVLGFRDTRRDSNEQSS